MVNRLQVFIPGTMRDLEDVREQVASVISSMGLEPVWAEQHGARNRSPRGECELLAGTCDIYLGIFGLPYGFRVPPDK